LVTPRSCWELPARCLTHSANSPNRSCDAGAI
jgi:hypothetical protein